jgi:hypothetical protein
VYIQSLLPPLAHEALEYFKIVSFQCPRLNEDIDNQCRFFRKTSLPYLTSSSTSSGLPVALVLSASNSTSQNIIRMTRRNTIEKGSQHHNNDAKCRHRFKKTQYESSLRKVPRQLRQRERMTAASEQEPILSRVHNLPTCQIEETPAAHRPASVQVPCSSLQLSLDISWHANTRCVNHAPDHQDQKLKSRSLLALDVIGRLTTTVDRGTSFDLQAEVI